MELGSDQAPGFEITGLACETWVDWLAGFGDGPGVSFALAQTPSGAAGLRAFQISLLQASTWL